MLVNREIVQSALQHLRIEALNPMQEEMLQQVSHDQDVILLSPTGSGKTLACLLPLLSSLQPEATGLQALILAPSRELALQIESVFKSIGSSYKICCCYGGHPMAEEKRSILSQAPAVIVGTPGRITDHLAKGNIQPETVRLLVIDEFDKSLELGFQEEMEEIISQLSGLRRRFLLSATDIEEMPGFVRLGKVVKLNFLDPEAVKEREERLTLMQVLSPAKDKIDTLYNLLCAVGNQSSIVFCNHRESVDRVHKLLAEKKMMCEKFHGGMEQPDREKALYKFRNGTVCVLISTDLAARGLDIPEVEHVIHYHLPVTEEVFTHRNGRTARWDALGTSYVILHAEEKLPAFIAADLPVFDCPVATKLPPKSKWVTIYIGKGKKEKLSKMDIAGFFYKKGNLAREDVGSIDIREHYSFVAVSRSKSKQLLNLVRGEKIKGMKTIIEEAK